MEKRMRATLRQLAEGMAEQRRRMPADIVEPKEEELELSAARSWIALKMTKEMAEEETLEGKVGVRSGGGSDGSVGINLYRLKGLYKWGSWVFSSLFEFGVVRSVG
ncbi:uncharacterized protein A4U43_C02F16340 [Asparagus officinalis]|uniref:Uncharacterized protein n=1 Tax=Asparagus officinalis TaxID=4686 RepID=A0A5P1FMQ4_ASPOF|nr:uncharacterized protein A4U43_C02F16340 [Asparagus officinalis]